MWYKFQYIPYNIRMVLFCLKFVLVLLPAFSVIYLPICFRVAYSWTELFGFVYLCSIQAAHSWCRQFITATSHGRHSVSNHHHRQLDVLFNDLLKITAKKSKLHVSGPMWKDRPTMIGGSLSQRPCISESVSMLWRHLVLVALHWSFHTRSNACNYHM